MKKKDFVQKYYPYAKETEQKTGVSAVLVLAQAAFESGWGSKAPGNMFFGVKDTDGINGNEQLVRTKEYSTRMNLKFPVIHSITPVIRNGRKMFKYDCSDYFRKYSSPEESFTDHVNFLLKNPRYKPALVFKSNPRELAARIADAGYATDPNYKKILLNIVDSVAKLI